jgi:hypothetical protein
MFRTLLKMILDAIKKRLMRSFSGRRRQKSIFPTEPKTQSKRRGIADSGETDGNGDSP